MSNELLEKVINTTEVGAGGGGLLNAEQSNRFIDYMWDATTLASEGRIIRMRSNTVDLDKVSVGQRITRLATEAVDDGINTEATFTKISLTTKKLRLDWELSSEALEDNIEGADLEDHIARKAFDGFKKLSLAGGNVVDGANLTLSTDVGGAGKTLLSKAIKAMPRKYMQRRNELRFYTGVNLQQDYINGLTNVYDGRGNPPDIASGVIRGDVTAASGSAGATVPFAYGIPLKEVPLFNETLGASANQGYIELTFPQNRVRGIKRDVQVHRNFSPKKDAIEYTVFFRTGVQIENPEALVYVKDVKVTS